MIENVNIFVKFEDFLNISRKIAINQIFSENFEKLCNSTDRQESFEPKRKKTKNVEKHTKIKQKERIKCPF